ncbi:hypothetical protein TSMEX_003654, partial [Taenia solium]
MERGKSHRFQRCTVSNREELRLLCIRAGFKCSTRLL